MGKLYKILFVLTLAAVYASAAFAQLANSASVQGTVEDASGAVISGATINLTNVGTNQQLHTTSNSNGFFTFTNLGPADYKVSVTMQGFASWEGVLTLRVSQAAQVNPKLTAATVSTHVTVRDVTPIIDQVNPTLSDVKNATTIESMPIASRNVLSALAFSPGVVANGYGGSGANFTRVNGIPGGAMNYLTDGQTNMNVFAGELNQYPQSTMTLQEVRITTSNGGAEFGRPGVVQMVTKSGTNNFHGQIFELNRNNHLQARAFHSGPTVPFLQHNEYGFQGGGPIVRNHTFFFFDMEWIKEQANAINQFVVPTQLQREGNLSDVVDANGNPIKIYDPNTTTVNPVTGAYARTPFSGNVIPANRLNPVSQKVLGVTPVAGLPLYPLPNIPNQPYWKGVPNYQPSGQKATINEKQYTVKVDQLIGSSRLSGRYSYLNYNALQAEPWGPDAEDVRFDGVYNGALSLTSVLSPSAVNVVHIGVQYNPHSLSPVPIPGVPSKLGLPTYSGTVGWLNMEWGAGSLGQIPSALSGADSYWSGQGTDSDKTNPNQSVSASDQFSWNHGNHQFMFGFDVNNTRTTYTEFLRPTGVGGNYAFSGDFTALQDPAQAAKGVYNVPLSDTGSSLADFLLGDTSQLQLQVYPRYHPRQTEYDGYVQDDWRFNQRLTLNLGLRYAYWTAFADAGGLNSALDPDVPGGMVVYAGRDPLPAQTSQAVFNAFRAAGLPMESAAAANYPLSLFTMPKNNWQPRIGFAYQLTSKTVIRGGWGIYQWILPIQQFMQATDSNPPFSYTAQIEPGQINGISTNPGAAELEFPIATANLGGPQPINQFMLGSQDCVNQPAGTCNPPGLGISTSSLTISQGDGFPMTTVGPTVKPQTVQEYNLTIGHELPWNTGVQISYIGNNNYNLPQWDPINYTVPRDDCAAANSPNVPACEAGTASFQRPYAVFATSVLNDDETMDFIGHGNTNELQGLLTHDVGGGLLLQASFEWMRLLNTLGGTFNLGPGFLVQNHNAAIPAALTPGYSLTNPTSTGQSLAQRTAATYANDRSMPDKTFKFNANYTLPFGRGERFLGNAHGFLNALVSGYNLAPFFLWHSGFYISPYSTPFGSNTNTGIPGGRGIFLAPGKNGILPKSQRNAQHWFDASIWDPLAKSGPTSGPYNGQTYEYTRTAQEGDFKNNIPFNYMTGPGFNELDLGLYKVTPLWRTLTLHFAAQFFNAYNHQNLGLPNNKGIITTVVTNGLPRTIQLQAKIVF